jgi:hypothetical protein
MYGKINLKEAVKNIVKFSYCMDGNLWYITHDGYEFPIPFEETKGGIFKSEHKGIHLMRWIRKWNKQFKKG